MNRWIDRGCFKQFHGLVEANPHDLTTASITFSVHLESVDTRDEARDNHLRSGDFFDIERYPTMTFTSTQIERQSDTEYHVVGDLSLHSVTYPASFVVNYGGTIQDPWGNDRSAFSAQGKINRSDYGMTYRGAMEIGERLLGNQVDISIEIQLTLDADPDVAVAQ